MKYTIYLRSLLVMLLLSLHFSSCSEKDHIENPDEPAILLNKTEISVDADGGDFSVEFQIENPINGENPAASCEAEWITSLKTTTNAKNGTIEFKVSANAGDDARECLILLHYAGAKDEAVRIRQAGAGSEKPEKPTEVNLEIHTYFDKADLCMYVDMVCESKNAEMGYIAYFDSIELDRMLQEQNLSLEEVMMPERGISSQISEKDLASLNGDGLKKLKILELSSEVAGKEIAAVLMAKKGNNYTAVRSDAEFPAEQTPEPGECNIEFDFYVDTDPETFFLFVQCKTANADNAYILAAEASVLDNLGAGQTLEEVMDAVKKENKAQKFSPDWMKALNGDGCHLNLNAFPGANMGFILEVSNSTGRIVKRIDATTPMPYDGKTYLKSIDDDQFAELVWDYHSSSDFEFIGDRPCILDFGTPSSCIWCSKLEPVLGEASVKYRNKVDFYAIDILYNTEAYNKMIRLLNAGTSIPLLILVDGKGNCEILGGYIPVGALSRAIDKVLNEGE